MMKKVLPIALLFFMTNAHAEEQKCDNLDNADQFQLTVCAGKSLKEADDELNRVYRLVLAKFANDKVFIGKFKAAQRAWLVFRDAQLAALYSDTDPTITYGSSHLMCYANEKADLTMARTKQLREWLDDQVDGDICASSITMH